MIFQVTRRTLVMMFLLLLTFAFTATAQEQAEPVIYEELEFPELPYPSRWIEVNGTQIHYLETGDLTGDPILLLHGIPAWSYIWRDVMPHLEASGRVIAMDLPGYGRSEQLDTYSMAIFTDYVTGFVDAMELDNLTLVVQDLGSVAGLSFAAQNSELVERIVLMEAALPPTFPIDFANLDQAGPAGELWQIMITDGMAQEMFLNQNFFIEGILPQFVIEPLTEEEFNAYRAPFPTPEDRLALLSGSPGQLLYGVSMEELDQIFVEYINWLEQTTTPILYLYVEPGLLGTAESVAWAETNIDNLDTQLIGTGSHFFQEDHPQAVGEAIANWLQ
ncbi:MAG: haloalkane dehalogenase [Chloroflexota bacterium]